MNELLPGIKFLQDRLTGAAGLTALVGQRIYSGMAPQKAAYPLVIHAYQSGGVTPALGADVGRLMADPRFLVKAVTQERDPLAAGRIANQIDEAIDGKSAAIVIDGITYNVQGCIMEQQIHFTEDVGDLRYQHFGGLYRLYISEQ